MKFEAFTNAVANLLGGLVPAAVTILTLPFIANTLGSDDHGLLTLVSAIIGYFAILGMNVTSGAVKFVAEYHATGSIRLRGLIRVRWRCYHIGQGFHAGRGVVLWAKSQLNIGENCYIGRQSQIECDADIGHNVIMANRVAFVGRYDHNYQDVGTPTRLATGMRDPDYRWKGLGRRLGLPSVESRDDSPGVTSLRRSAEALIATTSGNDVGGALVLDVDDCRVLSGSCQDDR